MLIDSSVFIGGKKERKKTALLAYPRVLTRTPMLKCKTATRIARRLAHVQRAITFIHFKPSEQCVPAFSQ